MKAFWHHLNDRERIAVLFMAMGCSLYLFYIVLYAPLLHTVDQKKQQLSDQYKTMALMDSARGQSHRLKKPRVLTSSQLLSVISTQLRSASFRQFTYQLEQTSTGDVQLSYSHVPYNAFMMELRLLLQTYSIEIKQLDIMRTEISGVVQVMVVISVR